ncbi:hypothetical protein F4775DRAFT_604681 [Biscogniauxia sp. FL1348]|nr:hypothetical protein F4775DRAFT_604681 [Biscogniauxia sp. FL1348]
MASQVRIPSSSPSSSMAKGLRAASSLPAAAAEEEEEGSLPPKSSSKSEVRQPEEASSSSSLPAPSLPPRFTRFTSLPPEIRYMIYDLALPPDVPELYILQADKIPPTTTITTISTSSSTTNTNSTDNNNTNTNTTNIPGTAHPEASQAAPPHPTVYTAYPVLMHVSREARVFAQSRTPLRPDPSPSSPHPRRMVPYRSFQPELDVLYVSWVSFAAFFRRPALFLGAGTLARVRHVAVDMMLTTDAPRLAAAFGRLPALRSLRVVLGSAAGPFWAGAALRRHRCPRRCALRGLAPPELARAVVRGGPMTRPRTLEWYLRYVRGEARDETAAMLLLAAEHGEGGEDFEIGAWDRERRELDLEIAAQVLVEYWRPPGEEGPRWVEKGRDNTTNLASGMAWDLGIR